MKRHKAKNDISTVQVRIRVNAPKHVRDKIGASFLRDVLTTVAHGGSVPGVEVSEIEWIKPNRPDDPFTYTEQYEIEAALQVINRVGVNFRIEKIKK